MVVNRLNVTSTILKKADLDHLVMDTGFRRPSVEELEAIKSKCSSRALITYILFFVTEMHDFFFMQVQCP